MENFEIIQKTENYISGVFAGEGSGHDWHHVDRVRKLALRICDGEGGDMFVTEMSALLHDLDDWKINDYNSVSLDKAKKWLDNLAVESGISSRILEVIEQVSFKGAGTQTPVKSVEAAIVQDADRLDAIGAIGIARTFSYGGHKNRLIYDPDIVPVMHTDFQHYKKSTAPTINHFFEKLLLLKDRMNTNTAKEIAEQRHHFMEKYLEQFFDEWENKR